MGYAKTILCLAASRKPDGRCIAGKQIRIRGLGSWVRPISSRETESISISDSKYENGGNAELLDKIQISFIGPRSAGFQTENHLIEEKSYWQKNGTATWEEVVAAIDPLNGPLWIDRNSTYHGHNDKIMEADTVELDTSLYLIRPSNLKISVGWESKFGGGRERHVRASFYLNDSPYKLMVTDPAVERAYFRKEDGTYPIKDAIICVSLTKIFHGAAFKLVAAVITPKRAARANDEYSLHNRSFDAFD